MILQHRNSRPDLRRLKARAPSQKSSQAGPRLCSSAPCPPMPRLFQALGNASLQLPRTRRGTQQEPKAPACLTNFVREAGCNCFPCSCKQRRAQSGDQQPRRGICTRPGRDVGRHSHKERSKKGPRRGCRPARRLKAGAARAELHSAALGCRND